MTCDEARELLGAHVDHELDLRSDLAVQAHLRDCEACRSQVASLQALHEAAQAHLARHPIPAAVARRLRRSVQPAPARYAPWLTAAAGVLAGVLVAVVVMRPGLDRTERDVIAAHARSLLVDHVIDVASSDSHTVKPWFHGKVSFGVPAASFPEAGFPLVGGRLDYIDGHEVAAVVYQRRKHVVNLFVWPTRATAPPSESNEQGYALLHWAEGGLAYWLVTDAQAEDLRELQRLIATAPR